MSTKIRLTTLISLTLVGSMGFGMITSARGLEKPAQYNLYFGDLHAHTRFSDGWEGTPADAYGAARAAGADFMATTDHSYMLSPDEWEQTLQAAADYTTDSFVAIPGYEFWMPGFGEVNIFNSAEAPPSKPGLHWLKRNLPRWEVPGFFYDKLAAQSGAVGLWVHPTDYGDNFDDFAYWNTARDQGMGLLEIHNYGSWSMPYALLEYEASYIMALDQGWHVMPAANSDTHSPDWISGSEVRTVLLAKNLTSTDLYAAMSASRGYATLDKNLRILYTLNGAIMGSVLESADTSYTASIQIEDPDGSPSEAITLVEVISDGGEVVASLPANTVNFESEITFSSNTAHYFYLRVTTASNVSGGEGVTAWTAPVWTGR